MHARTPAKHHQPLAIWPCYLQTLDSKLSNELDELLVHIAALDHLAELEVALDTGQ